MTAAALSHRHFAAGADECRRFLDANPDVAFFDLFFTNMTGVPRGKRLRRNEIDAVFANGRLLPGSLLVVDTAGRDTPETGLVWETGDCDWLALPIPGRLTRAPWLGDDMGQLMLSMHEEDRTPCALDPRQVLARVLDRFAADGLRPVVACELEFYLLDERRDRRGVPVRPRATRSAHPEILGLAEIEDEAAFLRELWTTGDALGLPLEGAIAESGAGQFELTLGHKADALAAADDAVVFKRAVKGVARRHRREATFMAKPWTEAPGSGLHVHVSVVDADGRNMMADPAPEGSDALRHALGGMRALMAESMAIFAPTMNSFRRLRRASHAPVAARWGVDNRTVALRIPAGPPAGRRIEHRVAGADAHPHLVLAAVLSGLHHGITRRIDPGEPTIGNGYADPPGPGEALPIDWFAAVDVFGRSAMLRDYLSDAFVDAFACLKRVEQARLTAQVTDVDYDWGLRNA